jgi:hypothetical protein
VLSAASGAFGSNVIAVLIRMSGAAMLVRIAGDREDCETCPSVSTAGFGVAGSNVTLNGEGNLVGVEYVPGIHVG